jgi:hypothetical protein
LAQRNGKDSTDRQTFLYFLTISLFSFGSALLRKMISKSIQKVSDVPKFLDSFDTFLLDCDGHSPLGFAASPLVFADQLT